jgi:hypothetical protein
MLTLATTGQGTSDASKACAPCVNERAYVCSESAAQEMIALDSVKRESERAHAFKKPTASACGTLNAACLRCSHNAAECLA